MRVECHARMAGVIVVSTEKRDGAIGSPQRTIGTPYLKITDSTLRIASLSPMGTTNRFVRWAAISSQKAGAEAAKTESGSLHRHRVPAQARPRRRANYFS